MSSNHTILITAAVDAEISPLVHRLGLKRDRTMLPGFVMYEGVYVRPARHPGAGDEVPVAVVVTGVGRSRAVQAVSGLLERHGPKRVLITGFAGALDPKLQAGEVIVPAEIMDFDTGRRLIHADHETNGGERDDRRMLCTIDRLIDTPAAKADLFHRCGAAAVDMESAAIAAGCVAWRIPWTCVRAISDAASDELPPFVLDLTRSDGSANLMKAAGHCLFNPGQIGPLIRLGLRSKDAAVNLAQRIIDLL